MEGGVGILRLGMYNLPKEIFSRALDHLKTGENVLHEYDKLIWMSWKRESLHADYDRWDDEYLYLFEKSIKGETFWDIHKIHSKETIDKMRRIYQKEKERIDYQSSYEYRRQKACIFTNNPVTRRFVFKRDGRVCRTCSTSKNLTLDHIIPVARGGEDSMVNLQVLCKSCNSSKSDK